MKVALCPRKLAAGDFDESKKQVGDMHASLVQNPL
jgi:hypothetical protein